MASLSRAQLIAGVIVLIVIIGGLGVYYYTSRPPQATQTPQVSPTQVTETPSIRVPVIRLGTDPLGSTSYKVGAFYADILNRELGVKVYVMPFPAGGNLKALVRGEIEFAEPTDLEFLDLYTYGKTFGIITVSPEEVKKMPVQTFWDFSLISFFLIKREDASKYKCWGDLAGKPVFLTPIGFGTHLSMLRALRTLGINVTHVEISLSAVADALDRGSIVATAGYAVGFKSIPPWLSELDLKMNLAVLNPCPHELEKLEKAGIVIDKRDAKLLFKKNSDMGEIVGTLYFHGFHAAVDVPENFVYQMLKALEKNAKDYAQVAIEFEEMAQDFVGLQLKGLRSAIAMGIPVHPGLAKFLKEKGVWNPEWDKYIAKTLIPGRVTS